MQHNKNNASLTTNTRNTGLSISASILALAVLSACSSNNNQPVSDTASISSSTQTAANIPHYAGTKEPFASEAIYFVMTDRYVDGDPKNNYPQQGGRYPTFDVPLKGPNGQQANVGYLGGDFQGILDHVDVIKDMGFTALWLTPIVDNPDEGFSGGDPITFGESFKDGNKTGYHGYWGVNFFKEDEHLVSEGLDFKAFTQQMHAKDMKVVLDIVANHGSPAFTMPIDQPKYGELYDANGKLVADHMNLAPKDLDPNNPFHQFFHREEDILQLGNNDDTNPQVLDYFVDAYQHWIDQGVDAFRIDTIRHMPHPFWKGFAARIRAKQPGFYMFGESFQYDADFISQHTLPENGQISVLDFPLQKAMTHVFGDKQQGFETLAAHLYLDNSPYHNVYDLTTFYDNHDMSRMNADDNGFIDANNWLFTARGIPVVYYGSEIGFMAGKKEHEGNRNYYGPERIKASQQHPIYQQLKSIATLRQQHIALQRGLQVNHTLAGDSAIFYRVYQDDTQQETALVLLNKADEARTLRVENHLSAGEWQEQFTQQTYAVSTGDSLSIRVPAHGVRVLMLNTVNRSASLNALLAKRLTAQ